MVDEKDAIKQNIKDLNSSNTDGNDDPIVVYKEKTLPIQLQNDCVKLIKLCNPVRDPQFPKSGKEPLESKWTTINNYKYNNSKIAEHINGHNNYGIIPTNGLCILDVDDIKAFKLLEAEGKIEFTELFKDTFTVVSGHASENHAHYYFKTDNKHCQIGKKIVLYNPETGDHLGEIYPSDSNAFVVGPNSKHESGRRYKANDSKIQVVDSVKLEEFIDFFAAESEDCQYQKTIPQGFEVSQNTLSMKLGLRIEDVAMPENARPLGDGEYQGGHPIHGSTTGHNFNINVHKNVWKCFRCDSGGDPAVWLAVQYGLISCSDAKPGVLDDPDLFKRLKEKMEEDPRYGEAIRVMDAEYRAKRDEERIKENDQKAMERLIRNIELREKTNDFYNPKDLLEDTNDYSILDKNGDYSPEDFGEDLIAEEVSKEPTSVVEITPDIDMSDDNNDENSDDLNFNENDSLFISKETYSNGEKRTVSEFEKKLGKKKNAEIYAKHNKYIKDTTVDDISGMFDFDKNGEKKFYFPDGKEKCTLYKTDTPHIAEMKLRDIFEPIPRELIRYKCILEKDNFITKYTSIVSAKTDAYHDYHYAAAFSLLSMIVDRNAVMRFTSGDYYPNVWCFILGNSSSSRKSTSIGFAQKLGDKLNANRKLPSDFTPESMIEMLANDSHRYYFKDEAGTLLAALSKQYMSSTRDILCELYDNKEYQRKLRTKKDTPDEFNVKDPYIVMLLSTTYDTFAKYTGPIDLTSGFLYRFLIFAPKYEKEILPMRPLDGVSDKVDMQELEMTLISKFKVFASAQNPIEFVFTPTGLKFFQEWQTLREKQCDTRNNSVERSTISRLITYALKLSMIFKIGRLDFIEQFKGNKYTVPEKSIKRIHINDEYIIEACRQIDEYFYPAAVTVDNEIGLDEENNNIIKVKMTLERNGGKMTRTKLMRDTHILKKELTETLETMRMSKVINVTIDKKEKLKPITWITLNRDLSDESDYFDPEIVDAIQVSDKNKQEFEKKYGKISTKNKSKSISSTEQSEINSVKPKKPIKLGF